MIVLTLSCSRACVQSDCSVYIALPSACRLITTRSGQAMDAPVAHGGPNPIAPPGCVSSVCRDADWDIVRNGPMLVLLSSMTPAYSGSNAAHAAESVSGVILLDGPEGRGGV